MDTSSSVFDHLPARQAFWLGSITSLLVLGTVGFIVLGSSVLKGGSLGSTTKRPSAIVANDAVGTAPTAAAPSGAIPVVDADDHIRGEEDAPITIIEYSDFQCPYCSSFHPTLQQIVTDYAPRVRWVFRHFPLSFHPQAEPAAEAAECAGEQGKFWEYGDALFANQATLGPELYTRLANDLRLNARDFQSCLDADEALARVRADAAEGASAGVSGTPGSFLIDADGNATPIRGALPLASVKQMVDAAL